MFQHIQWPADDQAQRLFHGRGHAWPGFEHLNIDWYAPLVLVTLYAEVDESWLSELEQRLLAGLKRCRPDHAGQLSVVVQHRCRTGAPFTLLCGQLPEQLVIKEDGLNYWLHLNRSQNTGLFLDMANGRRWVRGHSDGRRVLNLFAYTCGFSLAALAGGASKVVNVDMSRAALSHGRENHRLNDHDLSRVVFEGVDIFKSFGRLKKHGPYDLLICDPPTFQKGSVDIRRDYAKLLRRLPELMVAGGDCLLCLNAPDLGEDFLLAEVAQHAPDCVLVERLVNPPVFIEAQAGRGLKVLHFRYQP
ncbi:class I SAM-dependent methyltransferase [Thalassolituus sp. UBA2009]|uniref:class I SAM-dependent methyltransferase n=1 Tax=Thalassolituus sp. UBA2009 TaxID=1947658 RepID=UPI00257F6918|nr:class I SAM-dependent methyltransferase [Thalassolituus sp. UBA2009]